MTTLKPEHAHSIYGVSGRSFNVIVWNAPDKRWHNKLARLPALIQEFKGAILGVGLLWGAE